MLLRKLSMTAFRQFNFSVLLKYWFDCYTLKPHVELTIKVELVTHYHRIRKTTFTSKMSIILDKMNLFVY